MVVQGLLLLQTLIWFLFGIGSLFRQTNTQSLIASLIVSLLMFTTAVIFLGIAWGVSKRLKGFFYFALLFLAVHILLTVTDEFGIFDSIVLLMDTAILAILLLTRKCFT
jgi:hypothetical protein